MEQPEQGSQKIASEQPLISVVMPAYNADQHISEAIASVKAQTFAEWELVIVDDGSRDETAFFIQRAKAEDPRIRVIQHTKNRGPGPARNTALSACSGRYIAFLDADDLWEPTKLEEQLTHIQAEGAALCYSRFVFVDDSNRIIRPSLPFSARLSYRQLLRNNIIGCLTAMVDREQVGEIRFKSSGHEDYALWLELLKKGHQACGLDKVLARYRVRESSLSANKVKAAIWTWRVYRRDMKLPFGEALWFFLHYTALSFAKHGVIGRHRG